MKSGAEFLEHRPCFCGRGDVVEVEVPNKEDLSESRTLPFRRFQRATAQAEDGASGVSKNFFYDAARRPPAEFLFGICGCHADEVDLLGFGGFEDRTCEVRVAGV